MSPLTNLQSYACHNCFSALIFAALSADSLTALNVMQLLTLQPLQKEPGDILQEACHNKSAYTISLINGKSNNT